MRLGDVYSIMSEVALENLWELDDAAFEGVCRAVANACWDGAVDLSPPTPRGAIEGVLSNPDERLSCRVERHRPAHRLDAAIVHEIARSIEDRPVDGVVLATTGALSTEAKRAGDRENVRLLSGEDLCALCAESDVEVPDRGGERGSGGERADTDGTGNTDGTSDSIGGVGAADLPTLEATLDAEGGTWPAALRERVTGVLDSVEKLGAFERSISRGDGSTVIDFVPIEGTRPIVKARLGETSFMLYVRTGERDFESVLGLSAHRNTQPSLSALRAEFQEPIEHALGIWG
jgi:hypothetical protein